MERVVRPRVLGGIVIKKATGCGNMYVQMTWHGGKIFEVFATLGRSGACAMCYSEALTRSITTGLRCGVDVREYIDQLVGIRCPNSVLFPREDMALSCPDAIASVLKEYGLMTTDRMVELVKGANGETSGEGSEDEGEAAAEVTEQLRRERVRQDL